MVQTHLHPGNGSYSSIDLTIVDPSLLLDLHWSVHDDFSGSDHFPIIFEGNDPVKTDCTENWKLNKADWTLFENLCWQNILTEEFENETDPVQKFTDSLIHIASKYIPKISTSSKRIKTPWFTEDCKQEIYKPGKKQKDS